MTTSARNKGWHKGWEKNKHRDETSGKYDGSSRECQTGV